MKDFKQNYNDLNKQPSKYNDLILVILGLVSFIGLICMFNIMY